ncbi:MAG: hypothetical protein CMN31_22145 [Sandaracinus sp.]|nr:hypothetical protein [Myxococcales bacterium]MAT27064.1 hypothetical protein [Sandaracinus sp.]MBJ73992.1 hypothetical protein [Sandaracinus sp.]
MGRTWEHSPAQWRDFAAFAAGALPSQRGDFPAHAAGALPSQRGDFPAEKAGEPCSSRRGFEAFSAAEAAPFSLVRWLSAAGRRAARRRPRTHGDRDGHLVTEAVRA